MKITPEEYFRAMQKVTLLNDVFMSIVFDGDNELTAFVLKIMLNRTFNVKSVKTQYDIKNLRGRSVRLDIYAESEDGKKINIEIQGQDKGAGAKRARYNSSLIDANTLPEGETFDALPETYVIFITERDVLKLNEPIYFIERVIVGKNKFFNDEAHIVYVNNSIQDDTPLGRLMHDFSCARPDEMFYKEVADKVRCHKEEGKVDSEMDDFMDEIVERIRRETALEQAVDIAKDMIADGELSIKKIAKLCKLPLEKVQELAASTPAKNIQ